MDPRLFRAVVSDEREKLQRIMRQEDPEARRRLLQGVTPDGDSVLHVAARFGREDIVQYVYLGAEADLVGGAAVDYLTARNNRGDTVLHHAATEAMVRLLFSIGERLPAEQPWLMAELLRAANHGGETCLHESVRRGRVDVVKVLVEKDDQVQDSGRPLAQ